MAPDTGGPSDYPTPHGRSEQVSMTAGAWWARGDLGACAWDRSNDPCGVEYRQRRVKGWPPGGLSRDRLEVRLHLDAPAAERQADDPRSDLSRGVTDLALVTVVQHVDLTVRHRQLHLHRCSRPPH